VWSSTGQLVLRDEEMGAGREFARQVRLAQPGDTNTFPAVAIGDVLRESGHHKISLLKMDIEGAEAEVLGRGERAWLDAVQSFAIELHDGTPFGDTAGPFADAFGSGFTTEISGELTIGFRAPAGA
jgi:hypothetical protein